MLSKLRFLVAFCLVQYAVAGWWGGDDKPKKRRRRDDYVEEEYEADDYADPQYDYQDEEEDKPKYRKKWYKGKDIPLIDKMTTDERRQQRAQQMSEMNKMRSRNRDEMMTDKYTQQILDDELIEETHTSEENLDGYMTDDDINKIWAEHMHDFVPEDMTTALVEHRSTEALFETIGHIEPTRIKGAYYVIGGSQEKTISCIVYDPNRDVVYKRKGSAQGIILFDTTVPGEYSFIFSNMNSGQDLTVTLAMHTYEEKEEEIAYDIDEYGNRFIKQDPVSQADMSHEELLGEENMAATTDEITVVKGKLRDIQVNIKQLQSEQKLSVMRLNGHNEDMMENQDWNFYFMLIETVCFFAIVGFQTHHIKNMLDNKLII